jgi:prepilin-type N-terminal cleavage/methylation domain-containing protein
MKNTENTEQTPLTPLVRGGQNYFPLIRGIEGVCTKAFTLVELIVVITILSILWTVAFVSYDWQVDASKNTARVTDISNLGTSLKNHKLKSWWYPIPGDYFNIIYSWTTNIVAKQWFMNDKVFSTEIVSKPLDPDYKIPYIYSVTSNRWYYQLRGTISPEDDSQTEKAYLYWDYQTVAKTILPTLVLATSTWAGNNVEIASGTTAW